MIKAHLCPICEKQVSAFDGTVKNFFPFCSDRCRKVDLFRWSEGRYAVVEDIDPQIAEFMKDDPDISVQGEGLEDNS